MDFGIITSRSHQIIGVCGLILGLIGLIQLGRLDNTGEDRPKPAKVACEPACQPVQYLVGHPQASSQIIQKRAQALTTTELIFGVSETGQDGDSPSQHLATAHDTLVMPITKGWAEFISQKLAATEAELAPTEFIFEANPGAEDGSTPLTDLVAEAAYTSTNQVQARTIDDAPENKEPGSAIVHAQTWPTEGNVSLGCPLTSAAAFAVIPIEGPATDHPDVAHGDLNIALRGYQPVNEVLDLIFYEGQTDPDPPQLAGLFQPNRPARLSQGYQVNQWMWDAGQCGGQVDGCPGGAIGEWGITMAGLPATPGESISLPERAAQIYGGGYKALVLYAAEQQITLGYTRQDTVAAGYVVHVVGVCVDPNLLVLYRAQHTNGWRNTGSLPALRNDQRLGTAASDEIRVAIRDNGAFMDPRSMKDWWR